MNLLMQTGSLAGGGVVQEVIQLFIFTNPWIGTDPPTCSVRVTFLIISC